MPYELILVEKRDRVGLVILNRPEAMNALNHQILGELMDALSGFDKDESVGALVVSGSGKSFAVGADIKEMADASKAEMVSADPLAIFSRIMTIRKPVIAAVAGWALGGGCELALSCDMIIAAENARFGQPEITLGVFPGAGGTQRLTRAVGKALAMEIILNNRMLSAQEALQFGLVNRVASKENYLEEALKLADEIAARAPLAVRAATELIDQAFERTLSDALHQERQEFYNLFGSEDQKEGMQAFIEKRKPVWKGK
jgi:enoyl-CoA hydratase